MSDGWIKLHRSMQDHWLWKDKPYDEARAWLDLLLLANYEDKKYPYKGEIITCKRGDVNLSISYLANRWKWDRRTVKKFLKLLERDGMCTTTCTTHRTTITITNYGFYQDCGTTECTTKYTTKSQQDVQQSPTTKKDKKDKKVNTNVLTHIGTFENEDVDKLFEEFVKMRKQMKKPMSDRAKDLAIKKLETLSKGDSTLAIKIVEQTLERSWQTFYEYKGESNVGINNTEVHSYGISL